VGLFTKSLPGPKHIFNKKKRISKERKKMVEMISTFYKCVFVMVEAKSKQSCTALHGLELAER
jgi:hypothetical protein